MKAFGKLSLLVNNKCDTGDLQRYQRYRPQCGGEDVPHGHIVDVCYVQVRPPAHEARRAYY